MFRYVVPRLILTVLTGSEFSNHTLDSKLEAYIQGQRGNEQRAMEHRFLNGTRKHFEVYIPSYQLLMT